MSLSHLDQLTLLMDLLSEQQESYEGASSEYGQIKRLVKSMIANQSIKDEQLLNLLPEIYYYSLKGESAQNIRDHIADNRMNLESWLTALHTASQSKDLSSNASSNP